MRYLCVIIFVLSLVLANTGCGGKQAETTIELAPADQEGVQKALEFKKQMDAQMQQQMQNLQKPNGQPAPPPTQ